DRFFRGQFRLLIKGVVDVRPGQALLEGGLARERVARHMKQVAEEEVERAVAGTRGQLQHASPALGSGRKQPEPERRWVEGNRRAGAGGRARRLAQHVFNVTGPS